MNQTIENQIDSTDIRILEALMEDGRIAYSTLADEIGSSNTLVHQRVKKLKETGILTKPVFLVSPEHAGYDTTAFVLIIVREANQINEVIDALKKIPEVVSCISIMGRYDLMVRIYAGANLDELIETEFDLDNLVLKIAASENLLDQLRFSIQTMMTLDSNTWQLDTADFITIDQIEIVIPEMSASVIQNPQVVEKQVKIDQINAEYNYEKAQSNQMLDFFQVRYANLPFNADLNRELSFGLAINLPFKGTSRVNMSELAIDKNEASQNLQVYIADITRQVAGSKLQVEALAKRFRMAQQQWQDSQARFTLEHAENAQTEGPLTLLNARELQLKRQLNLLEIERDLMEQYLNILDWTGRLSEEPPINYLSNELSAY